MKSGVTFQFVVSEEQDGKGSDLPIRCFRADVMEEIPEGWMPWALILDRAEDEELTEIQKMAMTLDVFLRNDEIGLGNVHLTIENEPESREVFWRRMDDGYAIHLCAASGKHWCQVAYQLGYTMMHCLIDHLDEDGREGVDWAEELICETAALELLGRLWKDWRKTPFGKEDPEYARCVSEYLDEIMADEGTSALLRCRDREELSRINKRNDFDDRIDESHDLYWRICPEDLLKLAQVRKYEADGLLLNTGEWLESAGGSPAVRYICRLQERIM